MKTVKAASLYDEKKFFEVTVLEVVEQMPSLMLAINGGGSFPSLLALNDLFSTGKFDDGMSGGVLWEAFSLSPDDYEDLKKSLALKYGVVFMGNDELDSEISYNGWLEKTLKYCGLAD